MGRWAEVYFTSPPDRREDAVLDLLRELEAEGPVSEDLSSPAILREARRPSDPAISMTPFPEAEPVNLARCHACGHANPSTHTFCGMCGAQLEHESVGVASETPLPAPEARPETRFTSPVPQSQADELSLFRSLSAHSLEEEPSPRPYRLYIGAVLAIIILALGYVAWRSGQTQSSHEAPPPPPVTQADSGTPAASPSSSSQPSNAQPATPPAPAKAEEQPSSPAKKAAPDTAAAADVPKNPVAAKAPQSQAGGLPDAQALASNGGAELAMAQRYLTATSGRARDSAEGAKWLWKSIAKHNTEATLLLADLYLKGDGVSKNCDQARVLLDSAARKGSSAAGERLRNLQAFGCQ
jgi:hypothetical protein